MTPEQKAAFINAQTALLNCDIAGMVAENLYRQSRGESIAYTEAAFDTARRQYEVILGYNAVIQFFKD